MLGAISVWDVVRREAGEAEGYIQDRQSVSETPWRWSIKSRTVGCISGWCSINSHFTSYSQYSQKYLECMSLKSCELRSRVFRRLPLLIWTGLNCFDCRMKWSVTRGPGDSGHWSPVSPGTGTIQGSRGGRGTLSTDSPGSAQNFPSDKVYIEPPLNWSLSQWRREK